MASLDPSPQTQNAIRSLARGTQVNLIGTLARIVFVLLHSLLAARLLGATAYGTYTLGVTVVTLLTLVGKLGMRRTLVRYVALFLARGEVDQVPRLLQAVLAVTLPFATLLGLLLAWRSAWLAELFGDPALGSVFTILAAAVPFLALAILLGAFSQGFKQMFFNALALDIVRPGVELLCLLLLVGLGVPDSLSLAYTAAVLVAAALLGLFSRLELVRLRREWRAGEVPGPSLPVRAILAFALPVLAVNLLVSVTERATLLMLGFLGSSAMVGVFAVASRLVFTSTNLLVSTNTMLSPLVAELVERQQIQALGHLYKVSTRWILLVSLPFLGLLAFFSHDLLRLFGAEFMDGSLVLRLLALAALVNLATGSAGTILTMSGRPRISAVNEAVQLAVIVGLNLWLIPSHGALGAAWALGAGMVVVNLLRLVQVWRHLGIHPYDRRYFKIGVAAALMGAALWGWQSVGFQTTSLPGILLGSGLALTVYGLTLLALGLEADDWAVLRAVSGGRLGWPAQGLLDVGR